MEGGWRGATMATSPFIVMHRTASKTQDSDGRGKVFTMRWTQECGVVYGTRMDD